MLRRRPRRGGWIPAATLALLLAPALAHGAEPAEDGPSWGLDLGLHYGYFDRTGRLEARAPGRTPGSDPLQLDGTLAGLHGRLRLPTELAGGQPFVQLSGDFDASDAEDTGGDSFIPGLSDTAFVELSYQARVALDAGLEWETPPLLGRRALRLRPYGGLALAFWDAKLDDERGVFVDRDNEDFTSTSARLGLDVALPLVERGRVALDVLLGTRLDLPLGDAGEGFDVGDDASPVRGEVELDESWAAYTGLELRFEPSLPF